MITQAIYEDKKWTKGSSRQAILKYITSNFKVDEEVMKTQVRLALRRLTEEGKNGYPILIQNKGSYKLSTEWRDEWKKEHGMKSTTKKKSKRKTTKRTTKRKPKDKNAPKRALTAYLRYSTETRSSVQKKHPDASFGELQKLISAKWKKLSDSKKKKYMDAYATDKKRYEKEMKAYKKKKEAEKSSSSSSSSSEEESSSSSSGSKSKSKSEKSSD